MSCAKNEAFFALLEFMSKTEQSILNSHSIVKALFNFLDDSVSCCVL